MGQTNFQSFSGDDTVAFVGGWNGPNSVQVLDWRTGQVLRNEPGGPVLGASQPDGSSFMVRRSTTRNGLSTNDLWLVPKSGPSRLIDTDVLDVFGRIS
jgi:hypothetical protein